MHKRIFNKTEGYLTVEASMIVPSVIFLFVMIFYLTFYLYDSCVVAQDVYLLAFRGSQHCGKETGEVKQEVLKENKGRFGEKYISVAHFDSRVDVTQRSVTVEAGGNMATAGWKFGAKWQAQRICPTDCVRKVRLARKIAGEIKGMG